MHPLIDIIEIKDGINLVNPSVPFNDPVAVISKNIEIASNIYACAKVIKILYILTIPISRNILSVWR